MRFNNLTINAKEKGISLNDIHFSKKNENAIQQLLKEFKYFEALNKYDLPIDNKILLHGYSGCGKTITAKALANTIGKKIITLNLGGIISSRLGETAKNIASVFAKAAQEKAVLFIDEFDFVGKLRDYDEKDAGEMKRLVNTLIQLIDYLPEDTLLIAATNHVNIIDTALLRRFQLKLKFDLPKSQELDKFYNDLLMKYPKKYHSMKRKYQISYAEAKDIVFTTLKSKIIEDEENKDSQLNLG